MGLFRRKRKDSAAAPTDSIAAMMLPAGARCQVAGITYHQKAIKSALKSAEPSPPEGLRLRKEDKDALGWTRAVLMPWDDPHDPNAVAVFCHEIAEARQVGWIPKHLSADFRSMLYQFALHNEADAPIGTCPAYIDRWEEGGGLLGVRLCCSWPDTVLDDLDQDKGYTYPDET